MIVKTHLWLVIEETIGSDEDSRHIAEVCLSKEKAEDMAKSIEMNDSASKCYVELHRLTHNIKGRQMSGCKECEGTGEIRERQNEYYENDIVHDCPDCNGTGTKHETATDRVLINDMWTGAHLDGKQTTSDTDGLSYEDKYYILGYIPEDDASDMMFARIASCKKDWITTEREKWEKEIRYILWEQSTERYGDDGEMQGSGFDFKRQEIDYLIKNIIKYFKLNLEYSKCIEVWNKMQHLCDNHNFEFCNKLIDKNNSTTQDPKECLCNLQHCPLISEILNIEENKK
jgi:excinuclease UvrABC ATPase subunit